MEKEFVTYEQALKLKKLGFFESCFGWYNYEDLQVFGRDSLLDSYAGEEKRPLAPTYQQAFTWILDMHNLYSVIIPTAQMYWTFKTMTVVQDQIETPPYKHVDSYDYPTYIEARSASLTKLIEMAKTR